MRAYVSIDFEGLPGIPLAGLAPRSPQFQRSEWIVTRFARALAEKLLSIGFERVAIADSHGYMTNIDYREIPRGAMLIQGFPRPISMLTGIDEGYDAAYFIGYHAAAGTLRGYLDHTYSGTVFHRIHVNGEPASEYLLNALVAGEAGVPVVLVAGDRALETEVRKHTPWAVFVELKRGWSRYAASFRSLPEVLEELERGVNESRRVIDSGEARPLRLEKPLRLEMIVRDSVFADAAESIPGVKREDAYRLVYTASSARELMGVVEAVAFVGYGVAAVRERLR